MYPTARKVTHRPSIWGSAGYSLIEIMLVVGLIGVISSIAIPMTGHSLMNYRLTGDVRTLTNTVSLAKMRAASNFDHSRVYVDLDANTYRLETWQKTGVPGWIVEGASIPLSTGVSFGFSALTASPANTQGALAQAPQCRTAAGAVIANTACVVFNSRGIPIDSSSVPTALDAVYLTDGTAVYGVTASATGLIQLWTSPPSTATWTKQ